MRWDWEIRVPELETSVFVIPGFAHKNGEDRLVVLNRIAKSVVDEQRGKHRQWVFAYDGRPFHRLYCTAWKNARVRAAKRYEAELECACPDERVEPLHAVPVDAGGPVSGGIEGRGDGWGLVGVFAW